MRNETYILLIPVGDEWDARKVCEHMENEVYSDIDELESRLKEEGVSDTDNVMWMLLTDFMDAVNNEEMDVLTEHFIGYFQMKTDKLYTP